MNIQQLLLRAFFSIISVTCIQASESKNKMVLLQEKSDQSWDECTIAREALNNNPQCSAYMHAPQNISQNELKEAYSLFCATLGSVNKI